MNDIIRYYCIELICVLKGKKQWHVNRGGDTLGHEGGFLNL